MKEKKTIYLLDTNILINWAVARFPGLQDQFFFANISVAEQSRRFLENSQNDIFIPDVVWTEFLSVFLHKDIDTSINLAHTKKWLRDRETYIQQIEALVEDLPRMHWFLWEGTGSPYPDASEILLDTELINSRTFGWLSKHGKVATAKLLDGMDSIILIYLNELANQHKDKNVVLYSADFPLCFILPRIRHLNKSWFEKQTAAFCALFPNVRCRSCRKNNNLAILEKQQVQCENCGSWPLF